MDQWPWTGIGAAVAGVVLAVGWFLEHDFATSASAAATILLASVALASLMESRRLAEASAKTAAEDREWRLRPLLVVDAVGDRWCLRNVGQGPALNVRFAAHRYGSPSAVGGEVHEWASQMLRPIGVDGKVPVTATYGVAGEPVKFRPVVEDAIVGHDTPVAAVRYDDWFGNHYRSSSRSREIRPADWLKGSPEPMPAWMNEATPP